MIVEQNKTVEIETLGSDTSDIINIGIKDISAVKNLLVKLYSDPFTIIPQELASNGIDASRKNNNTFPYDSIISIDKVNNLYFFTCQDFGEGMSPEKIRNIYANLGASDKEDVDIGGFGIGSKSPFCYEFIESLEIITIYKGVKYSYIVAGLDSIIPLSETITDEPNGTTVRFQIKNDGHSKMFYNSACERFSLNPRVLVRSNIINRAPEHSTIVHENDDFVIAVHDGYLERDSFLINGIKYKLLDHSNNLYKDVQNILTKLDLNIYPKINDVRPIITREAVDKTTTNKQRIDSALARIADKLKHILTVDIKNKEDVMSSDCVDIFVDDSIIANISVEKYINNLIYIYHSDILLNGVSIKEDLKYIFKNNCKFLFLDSNKYVKPLDFKVTPYRKKQIELKDLQVFTWDDRIAKFFNIREISKKELTPLQKDSPRLELDKLIKIQRCNYYKASYKYTLEEILKKLNKIWKRPVLFVDANNTSPYLNCLNNRNVFSVASSNYKLLEKYESQLPRGTYLATSFIKSKRGLKYACNPKKNEFFDDAHSLVRNSLLDDNTCEILDKYFKRQEVENKVMCINIDDLQYMKSRLFRNLDELKFHPFENRVNLIKEEFDKLLKSAKLYKKLKNNNG